MQILTTLGVTTIEYTFRDGNGHVVVCDFTVTVLGAPVIECPPDSILECEQTFDPGIADLLEGVPPITWTYTITYPDSSIQSDTYTKDAPDQYADPIGPVTFPLGITTIEWIAVNEAGSDTCSHTIEIIDTIPPTFESDRYENCVDPLHWVVYDEDNPNPTVNHVVPNLEKYPVDFRTFFAGDTILDITDMYDDCCDVDDLTIYWRIDFSDTPHPQIDGDWVPHDTIWGTGQPSTYEVGGIPKDIYLWGDGVFFNTVTHHITYWVEDCNGNISDEKTEEIVITPRPQVIKEDY